jgi:ABC-type transport system substrate-binding protein
MRFKIFWLLTGLLLTQPLTGCLSVTRISELDKLERQLQAAENKNRNRFHQLEERLRGLENRNHYLRGMLTGLASGDPGTLSTDTLPLVPPPKQSKASVSRARPGLFGGTYRQAVATDPPKLDPAYLQDTTSHRIGSQILEGLVEFDDDLAVVPCIAKSWTLGADRLSYTFELRKGVKFHHGREVVAQDFVYSFSRILDPKTVSPRTWLFDRILGYPLFQAFRSALGPLKMVAEGEAPDPAKLSRPLTALAAVTPETLSRIGHPHPQEVATLARDLVAFLKNPAGEHSLAVLSTKVANLSSGDFLRQGLQAPESHRFVIRLARPFAPFLSVLAMVNAAVVPHEMVEEMGDEFAFHPIGAGPFRFVSWKHDVAIELEAFEDYFQGRPYLDRLRFRVIPDDLTRLTEFEVGNLESVNRIPDEKYAEIKGDPNFPGILEEEPILHVFYIAMNVEKPPFDDLRVRQAFNYAVNPHPIIEKIRKGRGQVAVGPIPPGLPSFDPTLRGYDYDLKKARELLAEAGYADPADLGIVDFWFNASNPQDVNSKIASVFQQFLRDLGVTMRLNPVDWGTFLDMTDRGDPAIMRQAWVGDYPDADNFLYVLFHTSSIGQGNASRYSDPTVDAWLERARESHDPVERKMLYRKAQRKIVADAPWIPLFHQLAPFLHRISVQGATLNGRGPDAIRFKKVWLDPSATKPPQAKKKVAP